MNKKIIAIAAAGALALPMAAQADVKVYGHAQVEVGVWGGDTGKGVSVEDNARGRLGVKASEDLGGGLKGIAKFEFKLDTADGDSSTGKCSASSTSVSDGGITTVTATTCSTSKGGIALTKRELLVGLKGKWGQFEAGRLKSAYKYYGGVKYDQYVATILEARGNAGMSGKVGRGAAGGAAGHNSFISDSLAYQGKFGMVTMRLTYDADSGGGKGLANDPKNGNAISAGVKIGKKKWNVILAYVTDGVKKNGGAVGAYSSAKVGGSVTFAGAHTIRGQYEAYNLDTSGNGGDGTQVYLNYIFKFGKNSVDVGYGIRDIKATNSTTVINDADSTFARIALKHKFSKTTSSWVGYRLFDSKVEGGDHNVISLGLRKDF